jgi:anti-sigma factor RsiW
MSKTLGNRQPDRPCSNLEVTDEEIMAYADGVLPDERLAAVRKELAGNPERMKELEAYLKTRERMALALAPIMRARVPDRLIDTIHEFAVASAPARGLRALIRSALGWQPFAKLRVPMLAVAALCLVLLGAWLGDYAARHAGPAPGQWALVRWEPRGLLAESVLQRALDATPSGEESKLSDRLSIKPVATLHTKAGAFCREFDVLDGGRPGGRWLACRGGDGTWLIPVPGMKAPKEYGVAGGSPHSQSPPIELGTSVLEGAKRSLSGVVVSPEKERNLIARRWREAL